MKQLSLSARPRWLDHLVGQDKLVNYIRRRFRKNIPKGILLYGPKGTGKTSTARILALSLQCRHQKKFGQPCKACRKNSASFPIFEYKCARNRGVDEIEKFVELASYEVLGQGRRKVFILDEMQRLSPTAQDVLLDIFEDDSNPSVWIVCSTRPDKIIDTIRSRLVVKPLRPLNRDDTGKLVETLLRKLDSELSYDELADALAENNIGSPRQICHAVESYVAGDSAEEAADVDASSETNTKVLIRSVVKGDWEATSGILKKSDASDVRAIRAAVVGYLRVVLLDSPEVNDRGKAVSEAIKRLSYIASAEDVNQAGALTAELYGLCALFSEYTL